MKTRRYARRTRRHQGAHKLRVQWVQWVGFIAWPLIAVCNLFVAGSLSAASVPAGFAESVVAGPSGGGWNEAVGITFESNGRMYVWERAGRVWFKDVGDSSFSSLLDLSQEVGAWEDHGLVGFALDPNFRVNGYLYLLYVVDRHHLLNFGTGSYNPNSNQYYDATIGRLTRYTCRSSDGFRSVDLASRLVLIGATKSTGFPICSFTHGVGSLVFGEDGTLLVSSGEAGSPTTIDVGGTAHASYAPQAIIDGILKAKENVGAYRSQLVDCLDGKILRIDPGTGLGLPSNPFYDAGNPGSARSRVWALGLRNPFRMSLKSGSGSHNPAAGNPGVLYVGDVGWDDWESLKVVTGPRQNFGWPLYEGLSLQSRYNDYFDVANPDAPNPLYPAAGCSQYFLFKDLLKEDTLSPSAQPPFANPCNSSQLIPSSIPQFLRTRPVLDWSHSSATTRTPIYGGSGQAQTANVGAGGSPVSGVPFQGNCAAGGTWYTGTAFPAPYQNSYYLVDWGVGVIKRVTFDQNHKPVAVADFLSNGGFITSLAENPVDGTLYYCTFDYSSSVVRKLSYAGNRTPVAVAAADKYYGPGPLSVQFNSSGSSDPDGQAITYSWNFGDGSAVSTQANPAHTFPAAGGVPTGYTVTLSVTDSGGLSAQATLRVAVNDTPPAVTITSPTNGTLYQPNLGTNVNLTASVTDLESSDAQLTYQWQTLLHHNEHNHGSPPDSNHVTTTVISPTACDGINVYYYRIILTVTDPQGLATVREVQLFPNCGPNTPPTITGIAAQLINEDTSTAALAFTIGDAESAAGSLTVSPGSSNAALVPTNNIVLGGSGANRTVTVSPAVNQSGSATITLSVSDGQYVASTNFVVTVSALDDTPTITGIASQTINVNTSTGPLSFTIGDAETAAGSLTLDKGSSNPTLVPLGNIVLGGSGANRTVTVTPAIGQSGTATITVSVSDGVLSASNSFVVTVSTLFVGSRSFTNTAAITIPEVGAGSPYPSVINVSGMGGTVSNVTVTLRGLSHTWADDIDVLLVSPTGQKVLLLSDAGGGTAPNNVTLTLSDAAAAGLSDNGPLATGTFKPANFEAATDAFAAPAPASPYVTNLTVFNGQPANGAWSLYAVDDGAGDAGTLASGWSLTITTAGGGAAAPTISDIGDQVTTVNTATAAIPFTVNDTDTPVGNLTLSRSSSNTTLVPTNNIVFGGSGANRTVTVTPAAGQTGSSTITVTASDGVLSASDTFVLTVNAVNTPPTITGIAAQLINEDTSTVALAFTIGDAESAAGSLTLTKGSSNQTLVPTNNIVFGGSGANRAVTVSPAANQSGSATITVSVSDGQYTVSTNFVVTVTAANDAPTITGIANQTVNVNTSTGPLSFTIGDAETAAGSLTLDKGSSNPTLVPLGNIVLGGSGANRTITVTPAAGQSGTATITVSVSDGVLSASNSFVVTVSSLLVGTQSFTNTAAITIPDSGAGTPYPSVINVSGMGGTVSNVTVTLRGLSHTWADDIDVLLVSPTGQKVLLLSDAGGGTAPNNVTLTLSDAAAAGLLDNGPLATGTFKPTNFEAVTDAFAGPAPASPYVTNLTVFNGQPANGAWSLYAVDDGAGDAGTLASGWSLTITTAGGGAAAPTISNIGDQVTTVNTATAAIPFTVNDADTPVGNLTLSRSSSNTTLVPTNTIVFGGSGANRTVTVTPAAAQTGSSTITVTVSDGVLSASDTFVLTVNAVNTPPTITGIGDQTINEDTSTAALSFTVGDAESAAGSLTLSKGSSNAALVPTNNIVFGGSGANRTVTVSPAANQSGSATITVSLSDGQYTVSTNFVVTVTAVNDAPTISGIANQTINVNTSTGPLSFTIGDAETAAGSLTLDKVSSNWTLVPLGNIVLGGSGANRTVTVTPAAGQSGTATITVSVSDGVLSASNSFVVTVSSLLVGTQSFTNTAAITIPDIGAGSPYPSVINVSGMGGTVSNVTVRLNSFSHTWKADVDMLLVSPAGQKVLLLSDAGANYTASGSVTITLSDAASAALPAATALSSGTFKPTDYAPADTFASPAPAGSYATTLATFNGQTANGTWSLYVVDDGPGDAGTIGGGWSLTITTAGSSPGRLAAATEPPRISAVMRDERGALRVTISGAVGLSYALEASSDFSNWTKVDVQDNVTGSIVFHEQPTNAFRFYRAVAVTR